MNRRKLLLAVLAVVVAVELLVPDGYERVLTVHLDVLQGMADKMASLARAGARPAPNDLTEMIYPLERARQFLEQHRGQEKRESYTAFAAVVAGYADLVAAVDAARGVPAQWETLRPEIESRVATLASDVERVRALLDGEA